jgi:terminase large subunit-like protein
VRLVLPKPHPAQYEVLRNSKRFNVLCCGRRWGKTTIAIDRLVRPALGGKPTAWFAPTYKLLSEVWRTIHTSLATITTRKNEQEHWIELMGGGKIDCWSLDDPDAGRGRAYARIVVDEAALVADLQRAWEQSVRPMLADYQGGAWFLSTPKGTANYFHTLYQRGQDPGSQEWASWQMPTTSNPHINPTEVEAARGDMTDLAFAQEYLAQFVTWAGAVFRRIMDAVGDILNEPAAMIGVDWGRTGDYTVFTALSAQGHLVAIDRFRGIEYALQRARLAEFWKRAGACCWIVAESNSMGGPVVEQLQADGLPVVGFNTSSASKAGIIQQLALAFERGVIKITHDPVLIGELQAFEGKPGPSGQMRYGAPAGINDDTVMSLAIAWAALTGPREERRYMDPRTGCSAQAPVPYQISPI